MKKYASTILALACATVGIGAAQAQQSKIQTGHRVPTASVDYRTELPQRSEMQPRATGFSWCDDSGGQLECGYSACGEDSDSGVSICGTISRNTSEDGWWPF